MRQEMVARDLRGPRAKVIELLKNSSLLLK
jgi:hypothetical protein